MTLFTLWDDLTYYNWFPRPRPRLGSEHPSLVLYKVPCAIQIDQWKSYQYKTIDKLLDNVEYVQFHVSHKTNKGMLIIHEAQRYHVDAFAMMKHLYDQVQKSKHDVCDIQFRWRKNIETMKIEHQFSLSLAKDRIETLQEELDQKNKVLAQKEQQHKVEKSAMENSFMMRIRRLQNHIQALESLRSTTKRLTYEENNVTPTQPVLEFEWFVSLDDGSFAKSKFSDEMEHLFFKNNADAQDNAQDKTQEQGTCVNEVLLKQECYTINLTKMTQLNMSTGRLRTLRRVLKSYKDFPVIDRMFQKLTYDDQFVWTHTYKCEVLPKIHPEYLGVASVFLNANKNTCHGPQNNKCTFTTMESQGFEITSIQRVYHPYRARMYELKKNTVVEQRELMLFHGTRHVKPEDVIRQGLDVRFSSSGQLGRGIYGSVDPWYSYCSYVYCDSTTKMNSLFGECSLLYVKFLLGSSSEQMNLYQAIDEKDRTNFDSWNFQPKNTHNRIFAVYDNAQCYIGYIIKFKQSLSKNRS